MIRTAVCLVFFASMAVGCKGKSSAPHGPSQPGTTVPSERRGGGSIGNLGDKRASGLVSDLRASSDGRFLTWLKDAEKPRLEGVPALLRVGELWSVSSAGGEPKKLGNGVSNFPGGYLYSADSSWVLMLVGFNAAEQMGELQAVQLSDPKAEKQRLGAAVSYMVCSPDSQFVAFVDGGVLKLGKLPGGPFRDVAGDVANAEFSPDSQQLLIKRKTSSGGALLAVKVAEGKESPTRLTELAGEYKYSPDGKWVVFTAKKSNGDRSYTLFTAEAKALKPKEIAPEVFSFSFSPDGKLLARIEGLSPEAGGKLYVGPFDGSKPGRLLGETVRDLQFTKDTSAVAWRDRYVSGEKGEGEGELFVATLPDGKPKSLTKHGRSYEWAPDNQTIAFTVRITRPITTVDLSLYTMGGPEPISIKNWVYDYDFTPDSKRLLLRSDCVREGRACSLLSLDVSKPTEPLKKLIEGVFGFKMSTDGSHVLFTYARTSGDLYDVGVLNLADNKFLTVEQSIRMPPTFLDSKGGKVAYLVGDANRGGVYVADKGFP